MPHEIAKESNDMVYDEDYSRLPPDPLKRALAEPNNLGAHLNSLWRTRDLQHNSSVDLPAWEQEDDPPPQPRLDDWLKRIETQFHEPWIPAFTTSVRLSQLKDGFSYFPTSGTLAEQRIWLKHRNTLEEAALKKQLEAGAKREPLNAFWTLALARWEWEYSPRTFYPPPRSNFAFPVSIIWASPFPVPVVPAAPAGTVAPAPPPPPGVSYAPVPGATAIAIGPHPLPPLVPNEETAVKRVFGILAKIRQCTYFDDGSWQASREMVRDWSVAEPRGLEWHYSTLAGAAYPMWPGAQNSLPGQLRVALWGPANTYSNPPLAIPYAPSAPPLEIAQRLPPQQLLQWGALLTQVSRLVDNVPRRAFSRKGRYSTRWLSIGWSLDQPRVKNATGHYVFKSSGTAQSFALKTRKLGYPDLAREALRTEGEFAARDALFNKANQRAYTLSYNPNRPLEFVGADGLFPPFALWSLLLCKVIGTTAWTLCPLWAFLTFWLILGQGKPSTAPARWLSALILVVLIGVPLLYGAVDSSIETGKLAPLAKEGVPPAALFAGMLAVLLALWCIWRTVAQHHTALISPENDRWHTHFLSRELRPWLELIVLGTSALLVLVAGASLAYFNLGFGSGTMPVPLGLIGINTLRDVMVAIGAYGLISGFLGFIIWLLNWRFGAKTVWPLTNGGLRYWKETIGASICILAWLYLFVAVAAWPSRLQAKHMIEQRWQMGDWVWLQKNL